VIDTYKFGFDMVIKQPVITLYFMVAILLMGSILTPINRYFMTVDPYDEN